MLVVLFGRFQVCVHVCVLDGEGIRVLPLFSRALVLVVIQMTMCMTGYGNLQVSVNHFHHLDQWMSHRFEKCLTSSLLSTTHHTCKTLPQLGTHHRCQLCVLWGHGFIVQMGVKNWCGHVCPMLMLNLKTILMTVLIAKEGPQLLGY